MPFDCVGNRSIDERECIGVLAQSGCRVGVTESGLGLKDLASFDEKRGHAVPKAVQRRAFDARPAGKACESVPSAPVVSRVRWSRSGVNSHGPNASPGLAAVRHSCSSWRQSIAVAVPIVSVRSRPDFGVPIVSADAALLICRTRFRRSSN